MASETSAVDTGTFSEAMPVIVDPNATSIISATKKSGFLMRTVLAPVCYKALLVGAVIKING